MAEEPGLTHSLAELLKDKGLVQQARLRKMGIDPSLAKVKVCARPVVGPHVDGGEINAINGVIGEEILACLQGPSW